MGSEDRSLFLLAVALRDGIVDYYETCDSKYALPPRRPVSDSSTPPQDDEEGQLTVHLSRWFYTSGSIDAEVQTTLSDPSAVLTAEYVVQLSRPSPLLQEDEVGGGSFPDVDEIEMAADLHMTDAATMPSAIMAAYNEGVLAPCGSAAIIDYTSAASAGGLSMGSWTVRLGLA